MVKIREIFTSIQGEGPFIGYKQLFIRLTSCNLNCRYCDTDFDVKNSKDYEIEELLKIVNRNKDCHSVSLTGGEPLMEIDFLKDFLPCCNLPVYLETNGTLYKNLSQIIEYVDYISSDIKLPGCTGLKPLWAEHDKFFEIGSKKILFAKMVFDETITENEIKNACGLCRKYDIELILQPKMNNNALSISSVFIEKTLSGCLEFHHKVRLIPQMHKFLNVR